MKYVSVKERSSENVPQDVIEFKDNKSAFELIEKDVIVVFKQNDSFSTSYQYSLNRNYFYTSYEDYKHHKFNPTHSKLRD